MRLIFPSALLHKTIATIAILSAVTGVAQAQAGYPGSLRHYSDNGKVPFRIGTAVGLQGGMSQYPINGYGPGLLSHTPQDQAYQALIRDQFNQIEPGNELKMAWVWTKGTQRVNGHYVALTNLWDKTGTLNELCRWAEAQKKPLTVRGHCMVYNQNYTLPHFPAGQDQLFVAGPNSTMVRSAHYTADDLRDMLKSYVQQVVDATMYQNASSRIHHHYRVVGMWDVTNEVVSENPADHEDPRLGFAYKSDDPWYNNGPTGTSGLPGYDYVNDIYRWAADEMRHNIGRTIHGEKITAADRFELYYNDYNLEWNGSKTTHALNLINHVRQGGGEVDGLGFQAHIQANGLNVTQFDSDIRQAIADHLRFAITENDCAINETPKPDQPTVAQQEINQGKEFEQVIGLCIAHRTRCDAFQLWGATDDGSWLFNQESTPFTRWVADTRPGPTHGKKGYWPKEGQYDPESLCDPKTGAPIPSGHRVSNAYDQLLEALKSAP